MYFTKYLKELSNYEPIVLTVHPKSASYKTLDTSFLEKVRGIKTYSTRTFELLKLYSFLKTGNSSKGIPQGTVGDNDQNFFSKTSKYIRGNWFIPDARVGWNFFATKKAVSIIKKEKPELIVTTGPPHSTHLIGLELKKRFDIKWMADLRDPWSEIFYNSDLPRSKKTQKKDTDLEYSVLGKADKVLTIGPSIMNLLASKIPNQTSKFSYIYNGFDNNAIDSAQKKEFDTFTLAYVGMLEVHQPYLALKKILLGLDKVLENTHIQFYFVGDISEVIRNEFENEFKNISFIFTGRVTHGEALAIMKSAHLLLNLFAETNHSKTLISGKLMEYIATGNPILCLGDPEGDAASLLSNIDYGAVYEKTKIDESCTFIEKVYSSWQQKKPLQNKVTEIEQFSRKSTTKELIKLIETI